MASSYKHHTNKLITSEVSLGVVLLAYGCAIYLLFRSKSLNIYQWCSVFGLSNTIDTLRYIVKDWHVPEFVKFCLPDGFYCASYILMIDAIWYKDKGFVKNTIISLVPIVTVSSEMLQYFGLVKGTFDIYDLICYIIPTLIYVSLKCTNNYIVHSLKQKSA